MTILMAPEVDDVSRAYWEACDEGRLVLQRCVSCSMFIHHPERSCPFCGSVDLASGEVSGAGVVEAFTVIHRSFVPAYRDAAPYTVGWIALDEQSGLRVFAQIVGADGDLVGRRVRVAFDEVEGFGKMPYFVLVEGEGR